MGTACADEHHGYEGDEKNCPNDHSPRESEIRMQGQGILRACFGYSPEHHVDKAPPVDTWQVHDQPVARLDVGNARANKHYECDDDEQRHPNGYSPHNCQPSVVQVRKKNRYHEQGHCPRPSCQQACIHEYDLSCHASIQTCDHEVCAHVHQGADTVLFGKSG